MKWASWLIFMLFPLSLVAEEEMVWSTDMVTGWEKLASPAGPIPLPIDGYVGGVNVVTGCYSEQVVDWVAQGIDPLAIQRAYFRGNNIRYTLYWELDAPNLMAWHVNYDDRLFVTPDNSKASVACPAGGMFYFEAERYGAPLKVPFGAGFTGYMNDAIGVISAQNNMRNFRVDVDGESYRVYQGDGSVRYFGPRRSASGYKIDRPPSIYRSDLKQTRLPSGNWIVREGDWVRTLSSDRQTVLNWYRIDRRKSDSFPVTFHTSDGTTIHFTPSTGQLRNYAPVNFLDTVTRPDGHQICYHYDFGYKRQDLFTGKDLPGGRFMRLHYDGGPYRGGYKVVQLDAPIGCDTAAHPQYRFTYGEGYTEVENARGSKTRYLYDENKRIIEKAEWDRGNLVRKVQSEWSALGELQIRRLIDGSGNLFLSRSFEYDPRGNIVAEHFQGDLIGDGSEAIYTKFYRYSDDGFNLLLEERDGVGRTCYSYLTGTNLPIAKLVYDQEGIRIRQFCTYDTCGALTCMIEDDGISEWSDNLSGCTTRRITRIANRTQFPGVGQPEVREELYWDFEQEEERLLKRICYTYGTNNQCIKEEIFDANGSFAYAIEREYDCLGRCVYETDPQGYATSFEYDLAGNLIKKIGPRKDQITEYGYDLSNRCRWINENGRMRRFRYDLVGNKLAEMDPAGNETLFTYDDLNREISMTHPKTLNASDLLVSTSCTKSYDVADNLIEKVDERGDRVVTRFNIRGQPIAIRTISKAGSSYEETFRYDLRGNCMEKTNAIGGVTRFEYDFLDRVIATTHTSPEGEILSRATSTYNAFAMTSTTDAEGLTTYFSYDSAGRESAIVCGQKRTEMCYDPLGNLSLIRDWYGEGEKAYTAKRMLYDLCGRLIEECSEDHTEQVFERVCYRYDAAGNRTEVITFADEETPYTTQFIFDPYGREIGQIDALGNHSQVIYEEDFLRPSGVRAPRKRYLDAKGNETEVRFNAKGEVEEIYVRGVLGQLLQHQLLRYDGVGNQISRRDWKQETIWQTVHFRYDVEGRCREIVEEDPSGEKRTTYFSYDPCGNLIRKASARIEHTFAYDSLGQVIYHLAKPYVGEAIETRYRYDRCGRVIEVEQGGHTTKREYSPNGHLIAERQATGLQISYCYDRQGRRLTTTLPDRSSIHYSYRGPHLYQIQRIDSEGHRRYRHSYDSRNLAGQVTTAMLVGQVGQLSINYDPLHRPTKQQTPQFVQAVSYDSLSNVIESVIQDQQGQEVTTYHYDGLGQLVQEGDQSFYYDGCYNRLDTQIGSFNQPLSHNGTTYRWSSDGELISGTGRCSFSCEYDALGRLVCFNGTTYKYDGFNRRIAKDNHSYLYDGDNEIACLNCDGHLLELRILGEGKEADLGAAVSIEIAGRWYAPIHTIRGDVASLVDGLLGKTIESYRYTAFGVRKDNKPTLNPWQFCSKRLDSESGWLFYGRRHYIPQLGRWTTIDPVGYDEGPNLYAYVHNNPLTHYDAYGFHDERYHFIEPSRNCLDFLHQAIDIVFNIIEDICRNIIPLPRLHQDIEDVIGANGDFLEIKEFQTRNCRIFFRQGSGEEVDGKVSFFVNGSGKVLQAAMDDTRERARELGDVPMFLAYNATKSLLGDLFECVLMCLGKITDTDRMLAKFTRHMLRDNPDTTLNTYGHSKGGFHLFNVARLLTPDVREQVDVNTFGSPRFVPTHFFGNVDNYASSRDLVCCFDLFNYTASRLGWRKNVHFLSPSCVNPIKEHFMNSPTYSRMFAQIGTIREDNRK